MIIDFQRAATDALQSMPEVLKKESSAGESYEAILDGARSLASALGSVLKVSSYTARSYVISDNDQDSSNLNRRRRSFAESILSFATLKALQRPKREAAKDPLTIKQEVNVILSLQCPLMKKYKCETKLKRHDVRTINDFQRWRTLNWKRKYDQRAKKEGIW